jgi:hypothetical protein
MGKETAEEASDNVVYNENFLRALRDMFFICIRGTWFSTFYIKFFGNPILHLLKRSEQPLWTQLDVHFDIVFPQFTDLPDLGMYDEYDVNDKEGRELYRQYTEQLLLWEEVEDWPIFKEYNESQQALDAFDPDKTCENSTDELTICPDLEDAE